ncbi:BatA domain-containing protein [Pontibacter silvestris]|uniref:BatA domain-containing protein n=1 Tax=Pontibacter silvestris TaxID=2305183 RepID=A0ABW4WU89_9BACT|nr:BatA domain-containing protein [Pontibacter silvestris]MCC9136122.1 BatA domain-containing protein [Pontibacter silvestris]
MAFLYPSFLFALSAISVPVILHLVQLRRAKRIEFSNVRFIQASKDLTASQRTLKEWLILLCRIFFIIFLVLAFAQPFLPAAESVAAADASDVTVVVDNSYSMQNMQEGEDLDLLTAAVDKAHSVLDLFPVSTAFSIVSSNKSNLGSSVQAGEAGSLLDNLAFTANTTGTVGRNSRNASHIFLISDFQKSTYNSRLLSELDSTCQIHILPLKGATTTNIAIDSAYLEDEFIRPASDNLLHVRIFNAGNEPVKDVPVKLFIDNQQVAALSIDIAAKQAAEAVLSFRLNGGSLKKAYVQVEDFPVEFDNAYYFTLAPSATIEIAEITDNAVNSVQRLYGNESFFRLSQFNAGNLDYAQVNASQLIVLNQVSSLSPALAASVANYVNSGGTVAVIPAAKGDVNGYESLFQNLSVPATMSEASAEATKTMLNAPDPENPFFKSIFSDYDPKMEMPEAVRSVIWARASEDVLKYRGGAPFLSRFDRGKGHLFLMAAPLGDDFSSLASHALFVPIMYKIAISSYKQEQQLSYTLAEGTISLPAGGINSTREGVYKLQHDSLAFIPEQQIRGRRLYFTVPSEMGEAGFYNLQLQDSTYTTLAFNYSQEESYLEQYSPDELRGLAGKNRENIHVYDYGDAFSVKGEFEKQFFGVKLWKYCLILCLFFLMAEIALVRLL